MVAPAFNLFMKLFIKASAMGLGGGADMGEEDVRLNRVRDAGGRQGLGIDPFKAQAQAVKARMPMQQAALRAKVRAPSPVAAGGAWGALKRMGTFAGQFLRR